MLWYTDSGQDDSGQDDNEYCCRLMLGLLLKILVLTEAPGSPVGQCFSTNVFVRQWLRGCHDNHLNAVSFLTEEGLRSQVVPLCTIIGQAKCMTPK